MRKIRIGIIGTASIAKNRFLPALKECDAFEFVGVASRNENVARAFADEVGGEVYVGYDQILEDTSIDAVYLPLPPALHYEWARKALEHGKHVLCEKPFTTCEEDTKTLVELAKEKGLVVHENYMFMYHGQMEIIKKFMNTEELGKPRLIRANFAFPKRGEDDFRYNKELGGGALLDCGGYTLKLMGELLGADTCLTDSNLIKDGYEVDLYGTATLKNADGVIGQVAFGMDNSYVCDVQIHGSKGIVEAKRVFTAPPGYSAVVSLLQNGNVVMEESIDDNHFKNSILHFYECIQSDEMRNKAYDEILRQSSLVEKCMKECV